MKKAQQYQNLVQEMYDLFLEVNTMRGCYKRVPDLEEVTISVDDYDINFKWEISVGCGDYDNFDFSYPAGYLDNPDWRIAEQILIDKKAREERKKQEALRKRLEDDRKAAEAVKILKDKELLKKLKEQYE